MEHLAHRRRVVCSVLLHCDIFTPSKDGIRTSIEGGVNHPCAHHNRHRVGESGSISPHKHLSSWLTIFRSFLFSWWYVFYFFAALQQADPGLWTVDVQFGRVSQGAFALDECLCRIDFEASALCIANAARHGVCHRLHVE
jgi:hypothetical protein